MTFIDCKCHNPDKVRCIDGKYYCTKCGEQIVQMMGDGNHPLVRRRKYSVTVSRINIDLLGDRVEQIDSMSKRIMELESAIQFKDESIRQISMNYKSKEEECAILREKDESILRSMKEEIENRTSVLRKVNANLCEKLDEKNRQISAFTDELDSIESKIKKIESDLIAKEKLLSNYETTIDKQTRIIKELRTNSDALRSKISALESENGSLGESVAHYRNEAEIAGRIPLRDMTGRVLDYMTSIYNIALDRCPQDIRDIIIARTEYFAMNLGNLGVNISFHKRGDELGNGRADVRTHNTAIPDEDCTVYRTDRFGCNFVNGIFADIPEAVTVNRFVPPPVHEIKPSENSEINLAKSDGSDDTDSGMTIKTRDPKDEPETYDETQCVAEISKAIVTFAGE